MSTGKGRHIFIHNVWSDSLNPNMTMRDMCFEISFINKLGSIDSDHYQVTGQCLSEMTSSLNALQTKKFVYDGTINECMTLSNNEQIHTSQSLPNHNQQHLFAPNFGLSSQDWNYRNQIIPNFLTTTNENHTQNDVENDDVLKKLM